MASLAHLPTACQWCDPKRPTTHVQSGPRHHRWEFMLLPGESPEDFEDPARVWSLLEPWFKPGDGPLTRTAVYEFRSVLAERMRDRRVLLVGDAAHLTPPFLGQGLCSGLRDAANAAWKLDLALRGLAPDGLLDTVTEERQPHNEWVIQFAIELGKVLCQLDQDAAAQRDTTLRQADPPPPLEIPPLSGGAVRSGTEDDPLAGQLSVQGIVAVDGREGRFDDVVGRGWALIAVAGDPLERLDRRAARAAGQAGRDHRLARPRFPGGRRRCRRTPDRVARRAWRACGAGAPRLLRLRQRRLGHRGADADRRPACPGRPHYSTPEPRSTEMTDLTKSSTRSSTTSTSRPPGCRR